MLYELPAGLCLQCRIITQPAGGYTQLVGPIDALIIFPMQTAFTPLQTGSYGHSRIFTSLSVTLP